MQAQPEPQSTEPSLKTPVVKIPAAEARREHLIATVFIVFTSFTFFLIQYDRARTTGPGLALWVQLKRAGTLSEGDQYRIGFAYLAHFLELHTPLKLTQSVPLIEFLCYAFALIATYILLWISPQIQRAERSRRIAIQGFFFAAAQFPILWIFPWERAETLPTTFYLAAIVLLFVHRSRLPFVLVCVLAVVLSLTQALSRSDAPMVVGLASVICAALAVPLPRPRWSIALLGVLCGTCGAATQMYLQHIFPVVNPAQKRLMIQLFVNLNPANPPIHLPIFFTALLPLFFSLFLVRRYHSRLDPSDKLVLLICVIYLPIFFTVGLTVEMRIFVPYLFLAAPTMAKLWTSYLFGDAPA